MKRLALSLSLLIFVLTLAGCMPVQANPPAPAFAPRDYVPVIAIESAFGAELDLLLSQVQNPRPVVINGRTFTRGVLEGHEVVLFLSGGSMYNSALTAQTAFDHFNVQKLIFSGISGGIDPALGIGDVVIGRQSAEYTEFLVARENADGTLAPPSWFTSDPPDASFMMFMPQPNWVTHKGGEPDQEDTMRWFPGDPDLIAAAERAAQGVTLERCGLDGDGNEQCLDRQPQIVTGNLVMGPWFMDNAAWREWLYATFDAQTLAMEEVYHACWVNQVPCVMLRSNSDLAGGGPGENEIEKFFRVAADNSSNLVLAILREIP